MADIQKLWAGCADFVKSEVSDGVWQSTFSNAQPVAIIDGTLVVSVPSTFAKERIEGRYINLIQEGLQQDGLQDPDDPIDNVVIDVQPASVVDAAHEDLSLITSPAETPAVPDPVEVIEVGTGSLNPKYTFETFVTGQSNRFAQAASLAVAETPAKSYNPLFIYGDAGLGKTHLLQAIGHYVHENYPNYKVQYVSTETFMNEFVDAIRTNNRTEFKRKYRDIDVLLVDDIQFMEGKEGLQEEFFHTFNTLHQANRQIVLSSDRPPDAISTLEDRLRSRFKMGLITDIQPPDLETRLAILRKKADNTGVVVPASVLEFIATHLTENIRELEGALIRVCAYASLTNKPLDAELAQDVLRDIINVNEPVEITVDLILEATCKKYRFELEELIGGRRHRPLVTARQVAMYVTRELTDLSYPAIARSFGGRDHTTVIHAVDKIGKQMAERRQIFDQVNELITALKNGDV